MRILLVDDEPALRELLRVTFESAEVTVDEAGSVREAEERIAAHRPDVIVLDLRMPGVSGAELATRLKSSAATRAIPVVLLTGAELEEAERAGADALVRKPFSPLELLAVIEGLTGSGPPAILPGDHEAEELLLYARDLRHMLALERRQRQLLEDSYLETVSALATALEWKDTGTHDHSQRVVRYALELLAAIDPVLARREKGVEFGFLLHDVGKIGIPDDILRKPGPLTPDERKRIEQHTILGEQMLAGVSVLNGAGLDVVRSHHERWDGKGYPDRLRAEDSPVAARVFAVADALDAMTSNRPYRRALDWSVAREEILAESGKQFDPDVVDAFRECEERLLDVHRATVAA